MINLKINRLTVNCHALISSERNYTDLTNLAEGAIRFDVSDGAAAAIVTGK